MARVAVVTLASAVALTELMVARRATRARDAALRELELTRRALDRAQDRVAAADRSAADLLVVVSHELRTPLTSVLGFTELLSRETFGSLTGLQVEILDRIDRGAHRLVDLVEGRLAAAEAEHTAALVRQVREAQPVPSNDSIRASSTSVSNGLMT